MFMFIFMFLLMFMSMYMHMYIYIYNTWTWICTSILVLEHVLSSTCTYMFPYMNMTIDRDIDIVLDTGKGVCGAP
jgi:hypothetical protein